MDDIADLSFASAPIPPSNKSNRPNQVHKQTSAFDYLSASIARSSSTHSSPNYHPIPNLPQRNPQSSRPSPAPSISSEDAFSSIFATTGSDSAQKSRTSTMTMAERLEAAQNMKSHHQSGVGLAASTPSTYGRTSKSAAVTRASSPLASSIIPPSNAAPLQVPLGMSRTSSEPWDFDLLETSKPSPSRVPSPNLSTSPVHSNRSSAHAKKDSWGIDPLSSLDDPPIGGLLNSHTSSIGQSSLIPVDPISGSLLGDEFGPLEDCSERLGAIALHDEPAHEDNILGLLGAPVSQLNAERIKQQAAEMLQQPAHPGVSPGLSAGVSSQQRASGSINRSASPPPHVLGQVVEIGFPPAKARRALLQTRNTATGQWDVSAAVESLLGSRNPSPAPRAGHATPPPNHDSHQGPPSRSPSSNHRSQANGHVMAEPAANLPTVNAKEIQDQAAELLAQASAYGSTALGKAASFWKQSKASLTKVIEDQAATRAHGAPVDGEGVKPKWMRDAEAISPTSDRIAPSAPVISFSDEHASHGTSSRVLPSASDSLVASARQPYVSSARRKVADRSVRAEPARPASAAVATPQLQPELLSTSLSGRAPSPSPLPHTASSSPIKPAPSFTFPALPVVSVSQQQISRSASHRAQGNELFKQGQYGHAESAYSKALDALQDVSSTAQGQVYFGCLPLFNNRAAARLKNGDGKGAREDVERVIEVLFCEDSSLSRPAEYLCKRLEASAQRVPGELREALDVAEQLGKALGRRARIREEMEKWADARSDWEHCRTLGGGVLKGAGGVRIVAEGLARCQKAVGGPTTGARAAPRPAPPPAKAPSRGETQAVQKLRKANEQAETEANEKLEAKDMVDAKIACWKAGKETNLRALLASLDQVLWKGLEWKKVGMGELLNEGQVKSKYVRAISKVHPDKIPKEASVVEKMIAKSVFATLNEAWISMQG